jgi:hypothetical protein
MTLPYRLTIWAGPRFCNRSCWDIVSVMMYARNGSFAVLYRSRRANVTVSPSANAWSGASLNSSFQSSSVPKLLNLIRPFDSMRARSLRSRRISGSASFRYCAVVVFTSRAQSFAIVASPEV